jgi:hypothetical protein
MNASHGCGWKYLNPASRLHQDAGFFVLLRQFMLEKLVIWSRAVRICNGFCSRRLFHCCSWQLRLLPACLQPGCE